MGYRVVYSPGAVKDIERLDRPIQKRVMAFVDRIEASSNPRFDGSALKGDAREWKYRIGDYRMVAEILDKEVVVWVVKVRHRSKVYK